MDFRPGYRRSGRNDSREFLRLQDLAAATSALEYPFQDQNDRENRRNRFGYGAADQAASNTERHGMQALATTNNVRISAFKAREVTRLIQGKPAQQALAMVQLIPRKAARLVAKTLKSAISNAETNSGANPAVLLIKEAQVGEAATMRRFRPKARGMAGRIRKRSSHIRIVVSDEQ